MMQIKSNALSHQKEDDDSTKKTYSPFGPEKSDQIEESLAKLKFKTSATLSSLKNQESAAVATAIDKLSSLKVIMTIAGVDDPGKTGDIIKYLKRTEELEVLKQNLENKLAQKQIEFVECQKLLDVNIPINHM